MKLTFFGPDSQGLGGAAGSRLKLSPPSRGVFTCHSCRVKVSFNNERIKYATPIGREVFGCGLRRAQALRAVAIALALARRHLKPAKSRTPPDLENQNSKEEFNGK